MKFRSSRFKALLRSFDLRTYLQQHDHTPAHHGGEWAIDCPQCSVEGKSKKLWVLMEDKIVNGQTKRAGHWTCYYCGEGGTDAISLIRWLEDCNTFAALELLASFKVEGAKLTDLRRVVEDSLFGVQPIEPRWDDDVLPEMALPYGFRPVTEDSVLPEYFKTRGISRKRALRYGLGYVPKANNSKQANRLVVPIVMDGRTVLYVARYMRPTPPAGTKKTVYPYGGKPNRVLFNFDQAKHCERVYLVEDVFSAMHLGKAAMATLGTQFSQYQMELLLRTAAEEVVIIWDRDTQNKPKHRGYEKALKLAARLSEFWRVRVVRLPDDRDPDELPRPDLLAMVAATPVLTGSAAWQASVRERLVADVG